LCFSLDSKILASGSWDYTVKVWDLEKQTEMKTLTGFRGIPQDALFTSDGKLLIIGDYDCI